MNKMNDVIDSMILCLNHIETLSRTSNINDVRVNVLSLRINNMINSNCDVLDIINMLDAEDSWVA